jgi:hypothetical protein
VPLALTNQASVFSNVVRQTSSALGVAAFTALVTRQEVQQFTDRAALLPANAPIPHPGSPAIPDWLGVWSLDQQTQLQTFADAVDWLFIIIAILTAAGMILAMFLPSRTTQAASAGAKTEVLVGSGQLLTPAMSGASIQTRPAPTASDSRVQPVPKPSRVVAVSWRRRCIGGSSQRSIPPPTRRLS